jgi:BlaI family transcriptional regulator, penicillinase repressor
MKMKELTRAEEEIMQILWNIGRGFVKDILDHLPDPKPAYNTVSTIVRILEKKGFVGYKAYGKTHEYFPLVSREIYTKHLMKRVVKKYFSNSFQQLVSFFTESSSLSLIELEEIKQLMDDEIKKIKKPDNTDQ